MSGISGIFNFNDTPVDGKLTLLGCRLMNCGPDGGQDIHLGPVGMSYRALHTNLESRLESQPLVSQYRHIITWDGRLDNRDDLLTHFPNGLNGDKTDVALVMAAYIKWGMAFLPNIIGDFALSLWDPISKKLLLARDPFGTRTLYYQSDNSRIVWSSTLESLLLSTAVEFEVDDEYIAGYLAFEPEMSRTPYRNVSAVEPGHMVIANNGQLQVSRFWKPDTSLEIRYKRDFEYEEHFRQLFHEAVRCRLRADRPVWSELSGGLDSSSIVCMADLIMEMGEAVAPRLETVSYIDEESLTSEDPKYLRLVEEKRGRHGHHIHGDGHWVKFASPEESFISKPSTILCVAGGPERLYRAMNNDAARVLLSGLGGDQVLWSTPEAGPILADLLFQRRFLLLHRQLKVWSNILKMPYTQLISQELLPPFLPSSLRTKLKSKAVRAPWLNNEFVNRTSYLDHLLPPTDPFGYSLPSSRMQASNVMFIVSHISRGESWEKPIFDKSYPFLHRSLVEFLMAIPFEQKLRPGETRSLMRRALKDVLPEKILKRRNKGTTGESLCRGIALEWPALKPLLVDTRICERGYVNHAALLTALELARHGKVFNIANLLKTISLEIWLRSVEHYYNDARRMSSQNTTAPVQTAMEGVTSSIVQ